MAFSDMKREIARAARITAKIASTDDTKALAKLYEQRKGLCKDQFFVWCTACGRNDAPMVDGSERCSACRR